MPTSISSSSKSLTARRRACRRLMGAAVLLPLLALSACEQVDESSIGPILEDDNALSTQVRQALATSAETARERIFVKTLDNNVIRLSGLVNADSVRHSAERIAANVDGVTSVVNTLNIR